MKTNELKQMIQGAMKSASPRKALMACRWRLRGPNGEFVGMSGMRCAFVPESSALIFDGRDNEDAKLAFYQCFLGELLVEVLPCAS